MAREIIRGLKKLPLNEHRWQLGDELTEHLETTLGNAAEAIISLYVENIIAELRSGMEAEISFDEGAKFAKPRIYIYSTDSDYTSLADCVNKYVSLHPGLLNHFDQYFRRGSGIEKETARIAKELIDAFTNSVQDARQAWIKSNA